jgi:hypothetical protein
MVSTVGPLLKVYFMMGYSPHQLILKENCGIYSEMICEPQNRAARK